MCCQGEFKLRNLGFSQSVPLQRFFIFHWRLPGIVYIIYRVIAAAYCLTWLIYTNSTDHSPLPMYAYLTVWTYTLETVYFTVHALFAVYFYFFHWQRNSVSLMGRMTEEEQYALFPELREGREDRSDIDDVSANMTQGLTNTDVSIERSGSPAWFACLTWVLFNCVSSAAIMVTIVFWGVLVPGHSALGNLSLSNLQLHLFNTVLLLIEQSVTAVPIRVLHVVYPFTYGMIYLLFSVFYWVPDHDNHVMYSILDWNKPGPTVGYVLVIGFVVIPVLHLIIYAIYRIKLKIFTSCCL